MGNPLEDGCSLGNLNTQTVPVRFFFFDQETAGIWLQQRQQKGLSFFLSLSLLPIHTHHVHCPWRQGEWEKEREPSRAANCWTSPKWERQAFFVFVPDRKRPQTTRSTHLKTRKRHSLKQTEREKSLESAPFKYTQPKTSWLVQFISGRPTLGETQ